MDALKNYTRFTSANPLFDFSCFYPSDWRAREIHGKKSDEIFIAGPPNEEDTYSTSLIVRVTFTSEANGHPLTLSEFVADYLARHGRSRTFRVLSQTNGFFGEFAASEIESSHIAPLPINTVNATDTTIVERRVIIHRQRHFYEVIYSAVKEDYDKYLEAFKVAVRTLEFRAETELRIYHPMITPALAQAVHESKTEYNTENSKS